MDDKTETLGPLPVPIRLNLPSMFSGPAVKAIHSDLLAALHTKTNVTLLGHEVDEAGTAAVQLIAVAARDFSDAGIDLKVAEPSDGLCEAFELLGMFPSLMQIIEMPDMVPDPDQQD